VTSSQVTTAAGVGGGACWGILILAWLAGALFNARRGPRQRLRRRDEATALVAVTVVLGGVAVALLRLVPGSAWQALTAQSAWVRVVGLAILAASTAFALWARFVLGTMWSLSPVVKDRHELRTDGPYGVTRHPIYTGLFGMLLGTVLLAGLGRSIVVLPVAVVVFELKIRYEEQLMLAAFPGDYPRYRLRVPQLVPGARRPRRAAGA
jgi:protein-S-isoprenylcysteine O-methyltransferase Ste14